MSRGFVCIGLQLPKTPANVGSVLRASAAFGVASVSMTGLRYQGASTDTPNTPRKIPFLQVADLHDVIPYDCVPVAVELVPGATPLHEYKHPERAFYVFGPEDSSLGKSVLSWCRDVIYIPTAHCLNLAACVNVVLYDRCVKRNEWPSNVTNMRGLAVPA
jgi:tRNA(Leu) C34 or U34 (ribose-2'-O)-methylase TrmL